MQAKEHPTTPGQARARAPRLALVGALLALSACGGPSERPPEPRPMDLVMAEDGVLRGRVQAADPRGRPLELAVAGLPRHGTLAFDVGTGEFTYRPAPDWAGPDTFWFTASAGGLVSAPTPVNVTVVQVDDAPRVQAISGSAQTPFPDAVLLLVLPEDGSATGLTAAYDPEGAPMTYRVVEPPAHGTVDLDAATGRFTYRPAADYHGADRFRFSAHDGILSSVVAAVALQVDPVNDAPVAAPQALELPEDGEGSGTLSAGDVDGPALAFAVAAPPEHGTLDLDPATGAFTYRPAPDWSGEDGFTFTASDGLGASAPAAVQLGVRPVNDPPVASDAAFQADEDGLAAGQVAASDVDSLALTFQVTQAPLHGALLLDPVTGSFTYAPERDWHGGDAFQVIVSDGEADSEPATISLQVLPVNDPPVAQDLAAGTDEDVALAGQLLASDVDGPVVEYAVVAAPRSGRLDLDRLTGRFTYLPAADHHGQDELTFVASDGQALSAPARVAITVSPVNDAPVAEPQAIAVDEDGAVSGTLAASDVEGDVLVFALSSPALHGTVQLDAATGAFTYRPQADHAGTDDFQLTAGDGLASSAPATVTVAIRPVDDPPVLPPLPDTTNSAETRETFIALPARDVDGEVLAYTLGLADTAIATAAVDETGTLAITPLARGETVVTVDVTDGITPVSASFLFTVTDVTKLRRWTVADTRTQAVTITNTADHEVTFELRHNGNRLAVTGDQLVEDVRALADEVPAEPFERKLWRFVRDETYHFDPLTASSWQHDPLLLLNSVGFGFCDDTAAVYASLASQAGYQVEVWDLTGHAVPEVFVEGRWAMYDSDLAVYYKDRDGMVASVAGLAADPTLLGAPFEPVNATAFPYSDYFAAAYTTTADNRRIGVRPFLVPPRPGPDLSLPAGAHLTYPGNWSPNPLGAGGDTIEVFAQLRLDLPAGFTGLVDWPLVPWAVVGSGRVRVAGMDYDAGSPELTGALQEVTRAPRFATLERRVEVLEASGPVSIVYLLNPVRFGLRPSSELQVRSLEAWRLDVQLAPQEAGAEVTFTDVAAVQRPR